MALVLALQQPRLDQLLRGQRHRRGVTLLGHRRHRPAGRAPGQRLEQAAVARLQPGERGLQRRTRGHPGPCRTQPTGDADDVRHGPGGPHTLRGAPAQGQRVQVVDELGRPRLVRAEQRRDGVDRGRRRHDHGLQRLQVREVEALQRPLHAGAGGGAPGEGGHVGRGGSRQVGPGLQQPGELVVGPAPQVVGERTGGRLSQRGPRRPAGTGGTGRCSTADAGSRGRGSHRGPAGPSARPVPGSPARAAPCRAGSSA